MKQIEYVNLKNKIKKLPREEYIVIIALLDKLQAIDREIEKVERKIKKLEEGVTDEQAGRDNRPASSDSECV